MGFAIAGFARGHRIRTVVDDVIEFVKQPTANVEGLKSALIAEHLIKVGEIDLNYEYGWTARGALFPSAWDHAAERHLRTITRIFNHHNIAASNCVGDQFP